MNRLLLLIPGFLLGWNVCLAQKATFWTSADAYLKQAPPSDTPQIFAPGLLADTGTIAMDRSAFSPDGKEFYYCQATSWFSSSGSKIKHFRYADQKWNGPFVLNTRFYAPTFSMDGRSLYFLNGVKGEVWQSNRTATGWTQPALYLKQPYGLYDFMPTRSGTSYVGSNGNQGDIKNWSTYDFCQFTATKTDTTIKSLGIPVNTSGFDGDFFVAPDESFMIVSAKETRDFECELFITYRKPDKTWTNPKSLGPKINDGIAHRWGQYVTPDHKYLFYTRGTDDKHCHIYWVRFDTLLEQLKRSNFAPYVKMPIANQTAISGKAFSLPIPKATFIDDDGNNTLTYSVTLPNGDPLPNWFVFDPAKRLISGTPPSKGTYPLSVTATDNAGEAVSCTFSLTVNDRIDSTSKSD